MNFEEAVYRRTLRGVSEGDFNLHGVANVQDLFDKLRAYRSKLSLADPLKKCRLPDEGRKGFPVRPISHCQRIKLQAGGRN